MAQLLLSPIGILVQQLSNAGQPLSGGQVFIYVAGTTTPVTTYTDSTGATPNSNPIVLNSAGRLPNVSVWVPSNTPHKLILEDSNGVTLSTIDQLYGINDPFLINQVSTTLPTGGGTANAQTVTNSTPITTQVNGTEQWYTPGVANTGATNINVDSLGNMAARYLTKALVGGELQPGVPVILKSDGTFWNLAWSAKGPSDQTYTSTGGGASNYNVTVNMSQTSYENGMTIRFLANATGTAINPSVNINSIGGKTVYYQDGATPLITGTFIQNVEYILVYSAALSGFICINPSRVTGSFTITLTGMTATITGTVNYAIGPDGKTVYWWVAAGILGTSNAGTMTGTGIPAVLSPTTSKRIYVPLEDNAGVGNPGLLLTGTSTIWTFALNLSGNGFTTSAQKGLPITQATYSLD